MNDNHVEVLYLLTSLCECVCARLHSCSCEVKFMQEHGVARL